MTHPLPREDLNFVQWLKGAGILLVVIGHFRFGAGTLEWLEVLRGVIYTFHMPLFMAISGFLYACSRPLPFGSLVKKKFLRLMIPYIFISGVVCIAKLIAVGLNFDLLYPPTWKDGIAFLLTPQMGFACFLWFLYTLFIFFCVVRALEVWRLPVWAMFILAIGIRFVPLPNYFCLNLVGGNLVFFVFGMGIRKLMGSGANLYSRMALWGAVPLCACFAGLVWLSLGAHVSIVGLSLLTPLAGISAMWGLAMVVGRRASLLGWFGKASALIYLLHTLCQGFVRYIWERGIGVESYTAQLAMLFSSVVAAMVLPALFQRFVLGRVPGVCRVLLGEGRRARGTAEE